MKQARPSALRKADDELTLGSGDTVATAANGVFFIVVCSSAMGHFVTSFLPNSSAEGCVSSGANHEKHNTSGCFHGPK